MIPWQTLCIEKSAHVALQKRVYEVRDLVILHVADDSADCDCTADIGERQRKTRVDLTHTVVIRKLQKI